jgi:hypothetical protein
MFFMIHSKVSERKKEREKDKQDSCIYAAKNNESVLFLVLNQ